MRTGYEKIVAKTGKLHFGARNSPKHKTKTVAKPNSKTVQDRGAGLCAAKCARAPCARCSFPCARVFVKCLRVLFNLFYKLVLKFKIRVLTSSSSFFIIIPIAPLPHSRIGWRPARVRTLSPRSTACALAFWSAHT